MTTEQVIGVAELDRRLRRAVEQATVQTWVQGEIGSLRIAASGHAYFVLKDEREDAVIDCVLYRMDAGRARRHLQEGARVQIGGRATVWAPRGRLQWVGTEVRPAGRGALLEALERLKEQLRSEGLFDEDRKRPLPLQARTVGVVTSSSGAAFHDIRSVAFRRGGAHLVLAPAQVQGEGAVPSLLRALDLIERHPSVDVVIVGRGGGSFEDLMAFNDERLVRRLAILRVPVVSAVGHEIDFTLADLVADARAATPSQAAELVIPDALAQRALLAKTVRQLARAATGLVAERRADVLARERRLRDPRFLIAERQQGLDELRHSLLAGQQRRLHLLQDRSTALQGRLRAQHPRTVLARGRGRLDPLRTRLQSAVKMQLTRSARQLASAGARLDGLSPLAVLGRGYAIALTLEGRAVRDSRELEPGQALRVRVHTGTFGARVTSVEGGDE
ncbi:MAG: exodeoxyribonuclease VII large subunit [Polyangiaceae bacterium]